MKNYVTAIDIGTTKIIAIAGVKEMNNKIRILGIGSATTPQESVKRGVVLNIEEASKAIKIAVRRAEENSGIKFKNAFIGIAGQHIKSQKSSHSIHITSPDKEIKEEDVESLKNDMYNMSLDPGEEIIHVIPQNYIVDRETGVRNPAGMFGRRLVGNFHIVKGQITSVKNIERCVSRINISINNLFLEPIASAKSVLTEDEREAGVALVDIGGGTTDVAVYHDGILRHTAVIPYGGNVITSDIKIGCSILEKYAEKLKVKYGKALSDFAPENEVAVVPGISGREEKEISLKELAKIIQARMEEICEIIDFELKNSGYRNKLGAGIALTGGGSLLQHLPQLMRYKTGLDVKLALPGQYLTSDSIKLNNPKFSTAVGLIKLGIDNYDKIKEKKEVPKEEVVIEEDVQETKKQEKNERRNSGRMFRYIKKMFVDFFDEKDVRVK